MLNCSDLFHSGAVLLLCDHRSQRKADHICLQAIAGGGVGECWELYHCVTIVVNKRQTIFVADSWGGGGGGGVGTFSIMWLTVVVNERMTIFVFQTCSVREGGL